MDGRTSEAHIVSAYLISHRAVFIFFIYGAYALACRTHLLRSASHDHLSILVFSMGAQPDRSAGRSCRLVEESEGVKLIYSGTVR